MVLVFLFVFAVGYVVFVAVQRLGMSEFLCDPVGYACRLALRSDKSTEQES